MLALQLTKKLICGASAPAILATEEQHAKATFLIEVGYCSAVKMYNETQAQLTENLPFMAKSISSHGISIMRINYE